MRRVIQLVLMVALLMMVALPALAQTGEGEVQTGDAISVTATVVVVSGGIAWIVEWLRGRFSSLDGDVLRVVALVLGIAAVFAWDLRIAADYGYAGLPDLLDAVVSGVVIAFGAGAIGSWKNAQRAQDPQSSIHEEGS